MEGKKEVGYRIVLRGGKTVLLREPKIRHRNLAAQAIGSQAGDSQFTFVVMMSQEMIRQLVHSINGKVVTAAELLDLDAHFTAKEYSQLEKVYKEIAGEEEGDGPLVPKVEIVPIGNT